MNAKDLKITFQVLDMIPNKFRDLVDDPNFANLGTVKPTNSPHVTPVWFTYDDKNERFYINTAKGRIKHRNMEHNPKVSLAIVDKDNPYRYLMVEGEVEEITTEGAIEHINSLAKRYMGKDEYPKPDDQIRLKIAIEPQNIVTFEG